MLFCIGQNISEASFSHFQLLPDLLERDIVFPQLNCSSLLSLREKASHPVASWGLTGISAKEIHSIKCEPNKKFSS